MNVDLALSTDVFGNPTLSMFVWRDGADFDQTMNEYMRAQFPRGIDPANPAVMFSMLSSVGNLTVGSNALEGNASLSS